MTDPYSAPASPTLADDDGSRPGCSGFLVFLALFVLTFAGVGAFLFLRAPDPGAGVTDESPLAATIVRPGGGYQRLSEDEAGGGRLDEVRTRIVLASAEVTGFRDAVLVSYGRPRNETPRAVVVLAVQLDSPANADALLRSYGGALRGAGATEFAVPPGWLGFHQQEESAKRFAQRVAFTRDDRLYVVSVVTPKHENDTTEVLALARRQAG